MLEKNNVDYLIEVYKIMKNKIVYYKLNGEISVEEVLNADNLIHTNGMMIKCYLKNGKEETGFSNPCHLLNSGDENSVRDYIDLCTWDNLDENQHKLIGKDDSKYNQTFKKVYIEDIVYVEAILHSNPRWGVRLTNNFEYFASNFTNNKCKNI